MNPVILAILLQSMSKAELEGVIKEVEDICRDPDKIMLLGKHPEGQGIAVCVPCTKSILAAMEETDKLFRQSKDDRLTKFTEITKCDGREDRYHLVLR